MRRFLILSILIIAATGRGAAHDESDKPITFEQLPKRAQQFINAHFSGIKISYAKVDVDGFDRSYEVFFVNGSNIEFNRKGEWTDIDCKFSTIPDGAVPPKILSYIKAHYPELNIIEMDRNRKEYEVKLSNGLELIFNLSFAFIGFD